MLQVVYQEAALLAGQGKPFVLATVVHTRGSTPQKPGAVLLIRTDDTTVGTLGGGCVEGDIWFAAKEALREGSNPQYKNYFLNEDIAAREGLVCGGSMYFYIEPMLDPLNFASLASDISHAHEGGTSLATATLVNSKQGSIGARIILMEDGSIRGSLGNSLLDAQAIALAKDAIPLGKSLRMATVQGDEVFVQGFTAPASLVLIGGGHVNLAVARLAQTLGFRIMVTDDRSQFANKQRFPMAEDVEVAPYNLSLKKFPITPNTAIVVATRGHQYDDDALEVAARTNASYVGLIGSKRKTILIFESLLRRGISPERLRSIKAPIGLDLGGRAPEEIAISIMAELVAYRHGHTGGAMKISEKQIDRLVKKTRISST